jgi:hypothetical protein
MTSDVVNPGPESGTQTEHNNIDPRPGFTTSLVMVLLCSICVPDPGPGFTTYPGPGLGQAHKLNTIIP